MEIKIPLVADEKGYIDRKCVNDKCEFIFKVAEKDLRKFKNIYCPFCGYHNSNVDDWITDEQYEQALEITKNHALAIAIGEINQMFSNLEKSTRNNKYCRIKYNLNKKIIYNNNPIYQREKWQLDIKCEKCFTEYSVIGAAYFCPSCGHNNIIKNINNSLEKIKNMAKSNKDIYITLEKQFGTNVATSMCQDLLENSLKNSISAFQTFTYELFVEYKPNVRVKPNDFQIISKGDSLFKKYFNIEYNNYISSNEIDLLNILFNKRHLLEHLDGIVDQKYLDSTNDLSYSIGQRIVIKDNDIFVLVDIIEKLCDGLLKDIV